MGLEWFLFKYFTYNGIYIDIGTHTHTLFFIKASTLLCVMHLPLPSFSFSLGAQTAPYTKTVMFPLKYVIRCFVVEFFFLILDMQIMFNDASLIADEALNHK